MQNTFEKPWKKLLVPILSLALATALVPCATAVAPASAQAAEPVMAEGAAPLQFDAANTVKATECYGLAFKVLSAVNAERKKAGLSPVTMDVTLMDAAMLRAFEITQRFDHVRPNGTMFFTACPALLHGENIAYGPTSAASVMKAWMNSEGHRSNILRPGFKAIGVGVAKVNGRYHWVQLFSYYEATAVKSASHYRDGVRTRTLGVTVKPGSVTEPASAKTTAAFKAKPALKSVKNVKGKKMAVKWKKASGASGYQIQYATAKSFKGAKTVTVKSSKTTSKTIAKLKKGKTYYVKMRAYKTTGGKKVYGGWTTAKKVAIKR